MAVVTSSVPEHCRTALTHLDLMKYFEGVTLAHDLGLEKKSPELWLAAAEAYGVRPEDWPPPPAPWPLFTGRYQARWSSARKGSRSRAI